MFRLAFWMLLGRRRPAQLYLQKLSFEDLRQQSMTSLLKARTVEDLTSAMNAVHLMVSRLRADEKERRDGTGTVTEFKQQNHNGNNNNQNQRR